MKIFRFFKRQSESEIAEQEEEVLAAPIEVELNGQ